MFNITNLIKSINIFWATCILCSCSSIPTTDDFNQLKYTNYGLITSIDIDKNMYLDAMSAPSAKINLGLYKAALYKAGLIESIEKQLGNKYQLEDGLNINSINSLCIMSTFLKNHEKYNLERKNEIETFKWVTQKQLLWKQQLKNDLDSTMIKNDCRTLAN